VIAAAGAAAVGGKPGAGAAGSNAICGIWR
jgi:hypothetical protein